MLCRICSILIITYYDELLIRAPEVDAEQSSTVLATKASCPLPELLSRQVEYQLVSETCSCLKHKQHHGERVARGKLNPRVESVTSRRGRAWSGYPINLIVLYRANRKSIGRHRNTYVRILINIIFVWYRKPERERDVIKVTEKKSKKETSKGQILIQPIQFSHSKKYSPPCATLKEFFSFLFFF